MHGCPMNLFSVGMLIPSGGIKRNSLSASAEDTASPMVSRRIDKDAKKEDAARAAIRIE